ncbi:HNH endonuclease [Massilia sp. YMA4]|uniref:HNH endonuclease n=1 Tax=Massilia sp. YMA4 TaxID=1593482 RepID=UPI001582F818|nr:HNH endonuclease [Massilia sp. YMA4]
MKVPFRVLAPQRTCTLTYTTYGKFKKHLARDFNNRCGYTDCHHKWFGGVTTFHIDHFKPHKKFPSLKTDYSNLVYSCSYVNILKSDDDPANYLDPCAIDYNQHFYRDVDGTIYPDPGSKQAVYMHKKLKLGLARYKVIWSLEKAYAVMQELDEVIKTLPQGSSDELAILRLHVELTREFRAYFDYLTG